MPSPKLGKEMRDDYQLLQKEYKNMEQNRKAYADECNQVIRKQQTQIDKLRKENEALKSQILLESRSTKPINPANTETFVNLQDQADSYTAKIDQMSRQLNSTTEQINVLRQKVLHERKHMGGVNAAKESQAVLSKQIKILENRLEKALVKFNEALAQNKELREQIDSSRKERSIFDNIHAKMAKELQSKKKLMAEAIEKSNLAYERRDGAQVDIAIIEQANRKEEEEFAKQIREADKQLAADLELGVNVPMADKFGSLTVEQETALKSQVNNEAWLIAKEKVNVQVSAEKLQEFEAAFSKIQAATGILDIEELVRRFIKNEDQSFSLFSYVNEQQNEIDRLEEQVQALKKEEAALSEDTGEDSTQQKQLLRSLEERILTTEGMTEKFETKCKEAQKTVNAVKMGIQSIFTKLQATRESIEGDRPVSDGAVTEANLLQYLGLIEERANKLLLDFRALKQLQQAALEIHQQHRSLSSLSKSDDKAGKRGSEKKGSPTRGGGANTETLSPPSPSPAGVGSSLSPEGRVVGRPASPTSSSKSPDASFHINPPNLEDYGFDDESDEEEGGAKPFTRDELKLRTLRGIQKLKHKSPSRTQKAKKT